MPLAYAFHIPTTQDIKLWPWVKEKIEPVDKTIKVLSAISKNG